MSNYDITPWLEDIRSELKEIILFTDCTLNFKKIALFESINRFFKKMMQNGIILSYGIDDYSAYDDTSQFFKVVIFYTPICCNHPQEQNICIQLELGYNVFLTAWSLFVGNLIK